MGRAFYLFEAYFSRNDGQLGRDYELPFASVEEVKNATIPQGVAKVIFFDEAGCYIYSPRFSAFDWEFHEKKDRPSL
jgi:hypothetical protein